jgi:hypothetical protein
MIFGYASWVTQVAIGCSRSKMRHWLPSQSTVVALCSLTHPENEHQWSVNYSQFCIYGNWKVIWPLLSITNLLAACFGKTKKDTVTAQF